MQMDKLKVGDWFSETPDDTWGIYSSCTAMTMKIEEVLHYEKSPYQEIFVFTNAFWGTVLVLDGVIQLTTKDEFTYQEMIAHLPLCSHPNPKSALVIGGGDGGVLRELCRHKGLERIEICEIDIRVIETAKKFLPTLAIGYTDPRVTVHVRDAFELIAEVSKSDEKKYDLIVCDSTDPVGFASCLFEENFFQMCAKALNPGGIMSTQGESFWHQLDLLKKMTGFLGNVFPVKRYAWITVPTYPCGNIGFWILSNDEKTDHSKPRENLDQEFLDSVQYYTKEIHEASFQLPAFARRALFENK
jgi:spermidine synthase